MNTNSRTAFGFKPTASLTHPYVGMKVFLEFLSITQSSLITVGYDKHLEPRMICCCRTFSSLSKCLFSLNLNSISFFVFTCLSVQHVDSQCDAENKLPEIPSFSLLHGNFFQSQSKIYPDTVDLNPNLALITTC